MESIPKGITTKKYEALQEKLLQLKSVERVKIEQEIEKGSVKGNKYYKQIKKRQKDVERRISNIEEILKSAKVVDEKTLSTVITLGSKVLLLDKEYNEHELYCIVDTKEANSLKGKISNASLLGKALLGKKIGEEVRVNTIAGVTVYKVLEIQGILGGYTQQALDWCAEMEKQQTQRAILENAETKEILVRDFVTRVNVFRCTNENHKLTDIRCKVKIMTNDGKVENVVIPGAYCKTCDKYFILENEFQQLRVKGVLLCKVVENDFWIAQAGKNEFSNLNSESLLHLMGYNVNSQIGLSQKQRWGILELLVDEKIMTITEICSHLQWLIRRNGNNHNFDDARLKWQADSNHIEKYISDNETTVEVNSIKRLKCNYKK